jgi:formate C-acetyltransferase
MMLRGYSERDAFDHCVISCAETGASGLRGGRTGGSWFCLAKVLELALNNGKDPRSGVVLNKNRKNKDLSGFESFDEVWQSFKEQIDYYLRMHAILDNTIDKLWEEHLEEPMAAAFGCPQTTLERGKPIKKGGAKYDFTGNETIGLANVANSLYAIKKLVFEDRLITGSQLLHAMQTNFEDMVMDPSGPEIQQMCLAVPKYGNDIDEVDILARDALAYECEELPKYKNTRYGRGPIGGVFQVSTTTVSSNTPFGMITGALPDGRKAWTPLADGQSPMRGTDTKGPTAAVNSVSKLRNEILSEGSLYNLKFLPNDLKETKGLKRFIAIIDHYFSRGGMQMQFNVVSRQTLLNAQKNPEKYSNLIVRVAGYSAYFTNLSKEVQLDIIERTEERI